MKKFICISLAAVMSLSLLSACSLGYKEPPEVGFLVADQFTGYKLGTVNDLVSEKTITELIEDPDVVKYSSVEKGLNALRNKKIHGMVLPAVYMANEMSKTDDFLTTHITFVEKQLRAISLNTSDFVVPVDAALTAILNNGTAQKIANAHSPYADESEPYTRPADYAKIPGRTITIGICSDDAFPYNYRDTDGSLIGINVDVAHEIAAAVRAELVIKEYSEDDLMGALDAGEVDYVMSQFYEDEQNPIDIKYLYSHNYCDASTYILIRGPLADYPDEAEQ